MIIISSGCGNGADGETRTLVGQLRPAVYETAAVAAEPHRRNGGSPKFRVKNSELRIFRSARHSALCILHLKGATRKAELNRRNQACEVLAVTGIRVARNGRGVGTRP